MPRKALSKRTRFEVFKRDSFTCQYCGRRTPDVVLEVDHVLPVVEGGTDELENLITSCFDCNRGKGGIPLRDVADVVDVSERARLIEEREEQLRAYNDVRRQQREREDADFTALWEYWFELWNCETLSPWYVPKESILRHYARLLPVEEIKDAMDIAASRMGLKSQTKYYLVGILKRRLAYQERRAVDCYICGKYVEIPDTATSEERALPWRHGDCGETAEATG